MNVWSTAIFNDQERDEILLFSATGLQALENHFGYSVAAPYPHLVLDGIFDDAALHEILREWPSQDAYGFESHDDGTLSRGRLGHRGAQNLASARAGI